MNQNKQFKVIIIGEFGTGTQTLFSQLLNQNDQNWQRAEFGHETVKYKNFSVKLQLWITYRRNQQLNQHYYRNTIIVIMIFNISQIESFQECIQHIEEVKTHTNSIVMLVGQKFSEEKQISYDEITCFTEMNNMTYTEISYQRITSNKSTYQDRKQLHWLQTKNILKLICRSVLFDTLKLYINRQTIDEIHSIQKRSTGINYDYLIFAFDYYFDFNYLQSDILACYSLFHLLVSLCCLEEVILYFQVYINELLQFLQFTTRGVFDKSVFEYIVKIRVENEIGIFI
ncbi:Rab1a [Hexamita inflata]|uniref:Rab1a n=1 Tax=Hexamita inflata TaxID=28002 RepID=A0AA86Q0T8_9EUKA|nr:Rab1a [Hexamita inflata]